MRDLINLCEAPSDPLDELLGQIGNYIQHNDHPDFKAVADALREHGYVEPVQSGEFYRAIFHDITEEDRARFETVADMHADLQKEIRFDLNRAHGFTRTLDKAFDFVRGTIAISYSSGHEPIHTPVAPLAALHNLIIVYGVAAPSEAILFSMRGLTVFMEGKPKGAGWAILDHSLNDMWDGYGSDDEVVIDTTGLAVRSVHLYDSERDN